MGSAISILFVSQQSLLHDLVTLALESRDKEIKVDCAYSLKTVTQLGSTCDLVLVDVTILESEQIKKLGYSLRKFDETPFIFIGKPIPTDLVVNLMKNGVTDYRLSTSDTIDDMIESIVTVLDGGISASCETTRELFSTLQELSDSPTQPSTDFEQSDSILTHRELQILRSVDEGKSNKEIAAELHLSLHTVKNHVHRILTKLAVKNRREAVHLAHQQGLLPSY